MTEIHAAPRRPTIPDDRAAYDELAIQRIFNMVYRVSGSTVAAGEYATRLRDIARVGSKIADYPDAYAFAAAPPMTTLTDEQIAKAAASIAHMVDECMPIRFSPMTTKYGSK